MSDPRWRDGYALLERHGLSYDLQAPWWHMGEAAELARDFPRTPIIVNHTALPADRSAEALVGWRNALETAAAQPNVALKISGLGIRRERWSAGTHRDRTRRNPHLRRGPLHVRQQFSGRRPHWQLRHDLLRPKGDRGGPAGG